MRPVNPRLGSCLQSWGRLALLAALLLAGRLVEPARARINVDLVPNRDSVQLTIYNSVDLTLVRETRFLTFRKGLNRLEFSWANTLIDPTSVEFKALTHADEVELLDASFPPRVTNTLEWRINSEFGGEVQVEIRYFTSGIKWSADYLATAAPDEKTMSLTGQVRVSNQSGEDYENAQIRLVVGVIKLVDEIAALARQDEARAKAPMVTRLSALGRAFNAAVPESSMALKEKEIIKEGLSEYFLYTVEGRDTIPSGWSKRLPSFAAQGVPLGSYYKYEKEQWGESVMRYYRFKNNEESHLGSEPLPDGAVKAFRVVADDLRYSFVGATEVKYIPVNETVEMELGRDQEVLVKPALMDWRKEDLRFDRAGQPAGWTTTEVWRVEALNSKGIDATVDIRRNFEGDWSIKTDAAFAKVDANKVKFVLPLKPHEKRLLTYEITTRHGLNATR